MLSSVGQKGQVSGPLDGHCQTPLMLSASAGSAGGHDLAPIGDETTQKVGALIVYDINLVHAKGAYLATRNVSLTLASLTPTIPCHLFVVLKVFV
jgi:hypothetical protein